MPHKYLLKEFEDSARSAAKAETLMQHISQRIHMHIPRYNWVGFYVLDPTDPFPEGYVLADTWGVSGLDTQA